jgi:hypothetical protein
MDCSEQTQRFIEHFGSHSSYVAKLLIDLSMSQQPCDVTFYKREPILDVRAPKNIALALMYGAGAEKLQELLQTIDFSDGTSVGFGEIWTINPMPSGGISNEDLESVDLSQGDVVAGLNGETVREIIRQTYHCESKRDEDHYLRRYLAS